MRQSSHESLSCDETVIGSSDRSFGIVMTAAFAVMSLLSWWHDGRSWGWTGGIAVFFLAAALLYPAALMPLNRLWLKFGLLLHKVMNPILMAFVFFGTVLPIGFAMRAFGKDPLRLKRQLGGTAIGSNGAHPGPPKSMKEQF